MIELLVRQFDGPGGRKSGDIVAWKEVPHNGWGKEEGPPNYIIVKINTNTKGIEQYLGRHVPKDPNEHLPEKALIHQNRVRSKFRINLDYLKDFVGDISLSQPITKNIFLVSISDRRNE